MKNISSIFLSLVFTISIGFGQESILPLWPEGIPNHRESGEQETKHWGGNYWIGNVQEPSLEVFLPTKRMANGQAVVVCPGGAYAGVAYDLEGTDIAKFLNTKGIAAFVLKYRSPASNSVIISNEAPLQDAQRALRMVRHNAEKWNIDTNRVGIMGFSAGAHLASTAGTHAGNDSKLELNALNNLNAKPDFMMLIYPVITMADSFTHQGSRERLIGKTPNQEMIDLYSNELQVDSTTPPTFLVHCSDDDAVPMQNSIVFYEALQRQGIYAELHIYPVGGHGFGLAVGQGHLQTWPDRLSDWLESLDR